VQYSDAFNPGTRTSIMTNTHTRTETDTKEARFFIFCQDATA